MGNIKYAELVNGQLSGYSMDRLIHFLILLDQNIEITIKMKPSPKTSDGRLTVAFTS